MIVGNLATLESHQPLLAHEAWTRAFDWLQKHDTTPPMDGEYEIIGRDVRAIVQTPELKAREECSFESHRKEIDLQYCFEGSERIEWAPLDALEPKTEYDPKRDFTLFHAPRSATSIEMRPGVFAIFFPTDGHMPGIWKDVADTTRKVVIKISLEILEGKVVVHGPFRCARSHIRFETTLDWLGSRKTAGRFDRIDSQKVTYENFLKGTVSQGTSRELYLVNLGKTIHDDHVVAELAQEGYRPVDASWVLELNALHPELMDEHIMIGQQSDYIGPEGAKEVVCLHKDAGLRRLRTHYADTNWGPHIWLVAEKIT